MRLAIDFCFPGKERSKHTPAIGHERHKGGDVGGRNPSACKTSLARVGHFQIESGGIICTHVTHAKIEKF